MGDVLETQKYAALIEKVRNSNSIAWEELYKESYKSVWFTIKKFIHDDPQAEDLLQDTYVQAYQKLDSLENPEAFGKWICMIAANQSKNYLKKKKPVYFNELENDEFDEIIQFEDEDITFQPEASVDLAETVRIVNEMLEKLPEKQKIALALHYGSGLSAREISTVMECKENTAKGYLKYGLEGLRKQKNEMEAKGIKLRSVAFGPFLYWYFRENIQSQVVDLSKLQTIGSILRGNRVIENVAGTIERKKAVTEVANSISKTSTSAPTQATYSQTAYTNHARRVAGHFGKTAVSKAVAGVGIATTLGVTAVGGKFGLDYYLRQKEATELLSRIETELNTNIDTDSAIMTYLAADNISFSDDVERYVELTGKTELWTTYYKEDQPMCLYVIDTGYGSFFEGLYIGEETKGKREGYGRYLCSIDMMYKGEWENDTPNGHGVRTESLFMAPITVEGEWKSGLANGEMVIESAIYDTQIVKCKEGKVVAAIEGFNEDDADDILGEMFYIEDFYEEK